MTATSQASMQESVEGVEGSLLVGWDPRLLVGESTSDSSEGRVLLRQQVFRDLLRLIQSYRQEPTPGSDTESFFRVLQAIPEADVRFERGGVYHFLSVKPRRVTKLTFERMVRQFSTYLEAVARRLPRFQANLTDRARAELAQSESTLWAVDDAVFALRNQMRERGLEGHIEVDAVQDPESPPPPAIAITASVKELTSERWFELWNELAREAEAAMGPWKPDHRIVVVVRRDRGGEWSRGNSTSLP